MSRDFEFKEFGLDPTLHLLAQGSELIEAHLCVSFSVLILFCISLLTSYMTLDKSIHYFVLVFSKWKGKRDRFIEYL